MKKLISILLLMSTTLMAHAEYTIVDTIYYSNGIYLGTERVVKVYVPGKYTGEPPACLYLGLDGVQCRAPEVIDSLIAVGKMPVTIGVFVEAGVVKNKRGEVMRFNRSNEFDMTDAHFAQFIEEELLPFVEGITLPDGRRVRLSKDGDDRMIFGLSSGGIASFNVAWQRPDLFKRVFCSIGTFVSMRGGNDLQALVRKHEPLPIRLFLHDGENDVWNPIFGHWYEANKLMASALDFAGYDVRYDWNDGGHDGRRTNQIYASVMEWLWHDWPMPINRGMSKNGLLTDLQVSDYDGEWTCDPIDSDDIPLVYDTLRAVYPDGTLGVIPHKGTNCLWQYYIDEEGNRLYGQPFYWLHSYDNSQLKIGPMAFDGDGYLYVVTNAGVQILDHNGRVRAILSQPDIDPEYCLSMTIEDGRLNIYTVESTVYWRHLNIKAPVAGVRPKGQGAG